MKKRLAAVLALVLGAGTLLALPAAATQRATLPDIEDEVMCPTCGVALNQSFSPQAERERDFIRVQIAKGQTKAQIKKELVDEFGPRVLATPQTDDSEFNLAAYLVPIAAVAAAAVALVFGLRRWRPRRGGAGEAGVPEISPEDAARLERDLSQYDA
jgi:cytochrome c-type biogenesis protein CcmH/NrfF